MAAIDEVFAHFDVDLPDPGLTGFVHQHRDAIGVVDSLAGSGHPASGAHAPNENIYVEDDISHIKHIVLIMDGFAAM